MCHWKDCASAHARYITINYVQSRIIKLAPYGGTINCHQSADPMELDIQYLITEKILKLKTNEEEQYLNLCTHMYLCLCSV